MWNLEICQQLVGETLIAKDINSDVSVELLVKEVIISPSQQENWESFTVLMQLPDDVEVYQGTFNFSHPTFGEQALFACPNDHAELEVILNLKLS